MTAAGHYMKALTFALQGEIFAIDAEGVREILDLVPITEVPSAPDFANGLINVRGRVVPLADLRVTFGMERPEPDTDTRIVVIEIELGGEPAIVGILADKVHDVADIETSAIAQGRHALAFGLCPRHRQAQRRLHHHPPKPAMSMPRLGAVTGIWPRRLPSLS